MSWRIQDAPAQAGRRALVTGTGGLGLEIAVGLARAGAEVIVAGRDATKGERAVAHVQAQVPGAAVRFETLDLASLRSVAALGVRLGRGLDRLDLLVNNAAVMSPPRRQTTADGFELQLGTNHLGHFALTAHLLPLLRRGHAPRVVHVSSLASHQARIDFEDLQGERRYVPMAAYAQSKLAGLSFAFELERRSRARGWGITSLAAHPGIARTDMLHNAPGRNSLPSLARTVLWFLFQPVPQAALPVLYAATAHQALGGGYYGPDRWKETRGAPAPARVPEAANDRAVAARLWAVGEALTGVAFDAEAPVRSAATT